MRREQNEYQLVDSHDTDAGIANRMFFMDYLLDSEDLGHLSRY